MATARQRASGQQWKIVDYSQIIATIQKGATT